MQPRDIEQIILESSPGLQVKMLNLKSILCTESYVHFGKLILTCRLQKNEVILKF